MLNFTDLIQNFWKIAADVSQLGFSNLSPNNLAPSVISSYVMHINLVQFDCYYRIFIK